MTVLAATIVTIKPQVVVSFVLKEVAIVHENAHLMRNYALRRSGKFGCWRSDETVGSQ